MFSNVIYLNNNHDDFVFKKKEKLNQNQFYQYTFSGEFVDKVSFYNIQDFNKKNKSLIRLY
jgi:hypothetical protein